MRTIPCGFLVVLCVVATVRSEAQSNRLTVDQAMSGRLLQGFSASPDGTRLLFTVGEPANGTTQALTHTWIYRPGSGEVRQFTDSVKSETQPRWSPNGRQVAFVSDREEFRQIYVMSADGGEAKRLTEGKRSIEDFAWSPNGEQIAFIAPDPKTDEQERKEHDKDDAWSVPTDSWDFYQKKPDHLWLIDVASGQTRQVVGAPWHFLELDWSASANRLIAAATDKPDSDHPADRIYSVSLADGKMRQLAAPPWGRFTGITQSPDGKYIGYVGARVDGPLPYDLYIAAVDAGSAPRNLTAKSIDRPVTIPLLGGRSRPYEWLSGQELAVLVDDGFHSKVYGVSIDGRAVVLASPEMRVTGFHLSGRSSGVLIAETMTQWPELWEWTGGSTLKRISHLNTSLDGVAMSQPKFIHYKSFDGRQIEAAVLTPTAVSGGPKPPAVILIHGGPAYLWYDSFDPTGQLLAAAGYAVLYPNIRGSVGYGFEFIQSVRRDWGGGDFKDIMAGADYLVSNGIADPKRLGIGGWSYGGYMAMWAPTQTGRFKAAVGGAGLSDLATEFGTEGLQIMDSYDYWYNGTPYENYEVYRKSSPITFIQNVVKYGRSTPTLILQGEVDDIDPMSQSQIWYRALRRYGVETEMVIYPREGHSLTDAAHLKDRLNRFVAWFDKYLK
jgi:dipeptidyl aminopeptidase/acylaminoacyl peptidase